MQSVSISSSLSQSLHLSIHTHLCRSDVVCYIHNLVIVDSKAFDLGHHRGFNRRVPNLVGLLSEKHPSETLHRE